MTLPSQERGSWRWTPQQDLYLYRRRREGAKFKQLAHELKRSEPTVQKRYWMLENVIESGASDVLAKHREEELELLERLLLEQQMSDCGECK